ncbi:hypothetical protein AWI43_23495 [Streptomyces sp. WAC04657]|uniref:hypothetical protein n=1 Tax=Streptomyces sp. WAC04657 TaxID=1779145 RepID=UPI00078720FC|nr:hypothetical protein [Streptomyces sp. WAC04657]KYG52234.1 hypothetical protein AWI43_23495 [Streptomyces sp. WAC04657]
MEQPVYSGTAHGPDGARFAVVGISNMPTDWAQVLKGLAGADLTLLTAPPATGVAATAAVAGPRPRRPARTARRPRDRPP